MDDHNDDRSGPVLESTDGSRRTERSSEPPPSRSEIAAHQSTRPVVHTSQSEPLYPSLPRLHIAPITPQRSIRHESPVARPTPLSAPAAPSASLTVPSPSLNRVRGKARISRNARRVSESSISDAQKSSRQLDACLAPEPQSGPAKPILIDLTRDEDDESTLVGSLSVGSLTPSPRQRKVSTGSKDLSVAQIDSFLREYIRNPKSQKDPEKTGYVYVATSPEREGLVKIGWTEHETALREESLARGCNITIATFRATPFRFKHAKRVETLAHMELRHFRDRGRCEYCGAYHREWFKLDEDTAYNVVKRWYSFVEKDPWTISDQLSDFWSRRLDRTEQPHADEEHADHTARTQRWEKYAHPTQWDRFCYVLETRHPQITDLSVLAWRCWCVSVTLFLFYCHINLVWVPFMFTVGSVWFITVFCR